MMKAQNAAQQRNKVVYIHPEHENNLENSDDDDSQKQFINSDMKVRLVTNFH